MRRSWVCWQLLLTWALLLGQLVSGEEEGTGYPLEESAELVEARQPEEAVEQAEVEEPEDPLEPEDMAEEPEDLLEPEDMVEPELNSEEELERVASYARHDLEEDLRWGFPFSRRFRHMALYYLQQRDDAEYRHLEDTSVVIQKAIGSTVKFRIFVKKGNCTEDEPMNHLMNRYMDHLMSYHHRQPWESKTACEKLDCTFTVFMDARTHYDTVVNCECSPLLLLNDKLLHQSYLGSALFDDENPDLPASDDEDPDLPASDDEDPDLPASDDEDPDLSAYYDEDPDLPASDDEDPDLSASDDEDTDLPAN